MKHKLKLWRQRKMVKELKVKQNTIVCQECEKEIDTFDSSEGVKTWYGVCTDCSKGKNQD